MTIVAVDKTAEAVVTCSVMCTWTLEDAILDMGAYVRVDSESGATSFTGQVKCTRELLTP